MKPVQVIKGSVNPGYKDTWELGHIALMLEGQATEEIEAYHPRVPVTTRWMIEDISYVDALCVRLKKPRWQVLSMMIEAFQQDLDAHMSDKARAELQAEHKQQMKLLLAKEAPKEDE